VDLSGWKIKDIKGTITTYIFRENSKINPDACLILKRPETKITLNNDNDGINLYSPDEKIVDSVSFESAKIGLSYNRLNSGWEWSGSQTPGSKNIISQINDKNSELDLPNSEKSGNSNKVKESLAAISQPIIENKINPWFLFLVAAGITIISAIIVLIFKKNVRT
jgi:hypothetical protein